MNKAAAQKHPPQSTEEREIKLLETLVRFMESVDKRLTAIERKLQIKTEQP